MTRSISVQAVNGYKHWQRFRGILLAGILVYLPSRHTEKNGQQDQVGKLGRQVHFQGILGIRPFKTLLTLSFGGVGLLQ